MLRLAADENFHNDIVRGLKRRLPSLDIIRVQDTEMAGADDPRLLDWAAREDRVLLTHDVSTITRHARDRIADGQPMAGVIEVGRTVPIRVAIEDLLLICECSTADDWNGIILYLPL